MLSGKKHTEPETRAAPADFVCIHCSFHSVHCRDVKEKRWIRVCTSEDLVEGTSKMIELEQEMPSCMLNLLGIFAVLRILDYL